MRIAIISDIHEDFQMLEKALGFIHKAGCNTVACLGDIVGFDVAHFDKNALRVAEESLDMVKANCDIIVAGNHDLYAIGKIPEFKSGFDYPENWNNLSKKMRERLSGGKVWIYGEQQSMLPDKHVSFLNDLNEFQISSFDQTKIFFSHYAYPDLTGSTTVFIREANQLQPHFEFIKQHHCMLSISGHRHPAGCLLASPHEINELSFGAHLIDEDIKWINSPCITRGKKENGFMILDSETQVIEVISLKKI